MAGLLKKAKSIPMSIPKTGPPIMGNSVPKSHAGIASMKHIRIPIMVLEVKNFSVIVHLFIFLYYSAYKIHYITKIYIIKI